MNDHEMQLLILGALLDGDAVPDGKAASRDQLLTWVPVAEDELDRNIRALADQGFVKLEPKSAAWSRVRLSYAGLLFVSAFRRRNP